MIERDLPLPGVGGSFQMENMIFQEAYQAQSGNINGAISEVVSLVKELEENNPYIGQQVVITTSKDMSVIDTEDGISGSIAPSEMMCTIEGFYADIEFPGPSAVLGVQVGFGNEPEKSNLLGQIPANQIINMELLDTSNPFSLELRQFQDLWLQIPEMRRQYPQAEVDDILEWFIESRLNQTSRLKGSNVNLLVCEISRARYVFVPQVPEWVLDETLTEEIFDDDRESEQDDDGYEFAQFRGRIKGVVDGFEFSYEDEDCPPELEVAIAINPLSELSDGGKVRYILIRACDISNGQITGGLILN